MLQLTSEGYHAKDGSKGRIGELYCYLEFGVMQELVATMLLLQYVKERNPDPGSSEAGGLDTQHHFVVCGGGA